MKWASDHAATYCKYFHAITTQMHELISCIWEIHLPFVRGIWIFVHTNLFILIAFHELCPGLFYRHGDRHNM